MDAINGTRKRRNGEIDFLRFVFAVMIVLHHSRYVVGDEACAFLGGSLAVEFYFLVSGYLLAASALRAGERPHAEGLGTETYRFVMHKIKAILPEWLIAWGIGFVFVLYADNVRGASNVGLRFVDYFWEVSLLRSTGLHIAALNGVMWYLSSMFLCMAILYPLLRKWPDMMVKVVCPLVALLLLGYLYQETGMLRDPHNWMGLTFKGNLRAMAELCCGVLCYYAARRFRQVRFTTFGRVLVTAVEFIMYYAELRYMCESDPSEYDFILLFVFVLAVILSFSGQGIHAWVFETPVVSGICGGLATIATTMFLSHLYYAQHLGNLLTNHGAALGLSDTMGDAQRMGLYLGMAAVNTAVVMALARLVRRYGRRILQPIKRLVVM